MKKPQKPSDLEKLCLNNGTAFKEDIVLRYGTFSICKYDGSDVCRYMNKNVFGRGRSACYFGYDGSEWKDLE